MCFMVKELLAGNGSSPSAHSAKYQQRGFRHSAPGLTRCHFVHAVNRQRQYVGEQAPYQQRMWGKKATDRSADQ